MPLTPVTEGEQFANAYFDTETKIKMYVILQKSPRHEPIDRQVLTFSQRQGYDLTAPLVRCVAANRAPRPQRLMSLASTTSS